MGPILNSPENTKIIPRGPQKVDQRSQNYSKRLTIDLKTVPKFPIKALGKTDYFLSRQLPPTRSSTGQCLTSQLQSPSLTPTCTTCSSPPPSTIRMLRTLHPG